MHRVPAFALLILVGFTPALRGQSTNASVTGRISDPSKAVIADAKIAAIRAGRSVTKPRATPRANTTWRISHPGPIASKLRRLASRS